VSNIIMLLVGLFCIFLFVLLFWVIFFSVALLVFGREGKERKKAHFSPAERVSRELLRGGGS
jgi:hypothetical protein